MKLFFKLLLEFGWKQALSCLFPVLIFLILAGSQIVHVPHLARYDLILLLCLVVQAILLLTKLETIEEMKVVFFFHLLGMVLEIFKVHVGSWSYPEDAWTKIFGVPLYSGFMYSSVASYMCQAWRRLDLSLTHAPLMLPNCLIGALIYLNFFTHHVIYDFRWILTAILLLLCWKSRVHFVLSGRRLQLPLGLSYFLIGFFIWIAENIATFFGAWRYPNQAHHWEMVGVGKISSWFLLCVISFIAIFWLKLKESPKDSPRASPRWRII